MGVAQSFCEVWETVATALAELDVLLGFADLAVSAPLPYVRPKMLPADEGVLELEGCGQAVCLPNKLTAMLQYAWHAARLRRPDCQRAAALRPAADAACGKGCAGA